MTKQKAVSTNTIENQDIYPLVLSHKYNIQQFLQSNLQQSQKSNSEKN